MSRSSLHSQVIKALNPIEGQKHSPVLIALRVIQLLGGLLFAMFAIRSVVGGIKGLLPYGYIAGSICLLYAAIFIAPPKSLGSGIWRILGCFLPIFALVFLAVGITYSVNFPGSGVTTKSWLLYTVIACLPSLATLILMSSKKKDG